MGLFSEASIQEVREAIDLVELAGTYTRLNKSGSEWKGACPLPGHDDKSPSFYVNEAEGLWHCFGCNRNDHSGDGIGLIEAVEGVGFRGAVRIAAEKFGVSLEAGDGREAESTYRVRQALEMAQTCFEEMGEASGRVETFRERRQLDPDTIEAFGVGYAPREWSAVEARLLENGVTPEDLVRAGLVAEGKQGRYGVFRDRIMFPIRNQSRQVIGFGGRRRGERGPKYVNTAETEVYQKKRALFGLWTSRRAMRADEAVFVVEGYTDALRLWDCGVKNVLASCGTSLTVEQVKRIPRQAAKVVTCFDGDDAGQKATAKGLRTVLCAGREEGAIVLPKGEDPDSFGRGHDETSLRRALRRREETFIGYTVRKRLQPRDEEASHEEASRGEGSAEEYGAGRRMKDIGPAGRLALRDDLIAGLAGIPSLRRAREYVRQCAWELGLEGRELLQELETARQREGLAEETETDEERDRRVQAWERYWERHGEDTSGTAHQKEGEPAEGEPAARSTAADTTGADTRPDPQRNADPAPVAQGRDGTERHAENSSAAAPPFKETPDEGTTTEDAPAEDAPAEDAFAEDAPAEDAPAEDEPTEDAPTGSTRSARTINGVPEEWLQGNEEDGRPKRDDAGSRGPATQESDSRSGESPTGDEAHRHTDVRSLIQAVVEASDSESTP